MVKRPKFLNFLAFFFFSKNVAFKFSNVTEQGTKYMFKKIVKILCHRIILFKVFSKRFTEVTDAIPYELFHKTSTGKPALSGFR